MSVLSVLNLSREKPQSGPLWYYSIPSQNQCINFFIGCLEVYIEYNLISMFHLFYKITVLLFEILRPNLFALHGLMQAFLTRGR